MDDFFTITSLVTLSGCVTIVIVIVNGMRHALNWGPRWFGLFVSIVISFIALYITNNIEDGVHKDLEMINYLIAFFNGFLIYASAFGVQTGLISAPPAGSGGTLTFRSAW